MIKPWIWGTNGYHISDKSMFRQETLVFGSKPFVCKWVPRRSSVSSPLHLVACLDLGSLVQHCMEPPGSYISYSGQGNNHFSQLQMSWDFICYTWRWLSIGAPTLYMLNCPMMFARVDCLSSQGYCLSTWYPKHVQFVVKFVFFEIACPSVLSFNYQIDLAILWGLESSANDKNDVMRHLVSAGDADNDLDESCFFSMIQ
jgi:hypothetical protein